MVVDTDRTASQILSVMNRNKMGGEVTFLPLNKLQPPSSRFPSTTVRYLNDSLLCIWNDEVSFANVKGGNGFNYKPSYWIIHQIDDYLDILVYTHTHTVT